jgi:hypothetical protein
MSCPDGFWCFQLKDIVNALILVVTVWAIIWGPVRAVEFSRKRDQTIENRKRKYEIFHALMKTRRVTLSNEHVMALNLIQLEFHDCPDVISSYTNYMKHLSTETPSSNIEKFLEERDDGLFDLLYQIGKALKLHFDKRDLQKFSYSPMGWGNDETEARTFRHLVVQLLKGERPLPVSQYRISDAKSKFPPPPDQS